MPFVEQVRACFFTKRQLRFPNGPPEPPRLNLPRDFGELGDRVLRGENGGNGDLGRRQPASAEDLHQLQPVGVIFPAGRHLAGGGEGRREHQSVLGSCAQGEARQRGNREQVGCPVLIPRFSQFAHDGDRLPALGAAGIDVEEQHGGIVGEAARGIGEGAHVGRGGETDVDRAVGAPPIQRGAQRDVGLEDRHSSGAGEAGKVGMSAYKSSVCRERAVPESIAGQDRFGAAGGQHRFDASGKEDEHGRGA